MSQGAGHRVPSSTAHWVFAQEVWSTQDMCYHNFCSFNSTGSCFKSSRNCFETLSPSCTPHQDTPNPIPSAALALTSPTPVPRLRPSRVGTAPSFPGHHPELVRSVQLLPMQETECNLSIPHDGPCQHSARQSPAHLSLRGAECHSGWKWDRKSEIISHSSIWELGY